VDPTEFRVNEDARFRKIDVLAPQGCGWSASSNAEWIRITRGANGSGDGEVEIWIEENRREERVGTLTVAGQTVTVTQRK
jgi:Putative binding domain, N-terminal